MPPVGQESTHASPKDLIAHVQFKGIDFSLQTGLFINGQFCKSVSGKTFVTVNPSTGEEICHVQEADKADVDKAVRAAHAASKSWAKVAPHERGIMLGRLADLVEKNKELLARIESLDNGKHFTEAMAADMPLVIKTMRYYAGWADKVYGQVIDLDDDTHVYTKHEPFGVVGQIIPWNFPLLMLAWKFGPALATGNCIVMKTSEKTPLSALKIAELVVEAGFPPGVVNILSGYGPTAGDAIARHPDITKVAFTGSTPVGRKVFMAAAESNLKKVSLELGGKSPNIVFDDADIDKAVEATIVGFTLNHGQCCCAGTRLFIQEGVYDQFISKLKVAMRRVKLGDQFTDGVNHGPLVDELQFKRVLSYLEDGKKAGAKVELGGGRFGNKGYFVEPTIFSEVTDDMRIVREEIFGPVVCAMRFKTMEEVVERANDSNYGLAAAIHTRNLHVAHRMANEVKAGTVWINTYNRLDPQVPFGGFKESGVGRENGEYALMEYTQVKAVIMSF
ncbi:aldehyde dehydrogenase domain-containing protein [Cladochytrium replicatum]|nr:aldehyde dehydrogenase domain-containing protein [Cladochytrium replicatum]